MTAKKWTADQKLCVRHPEDASASEGEVVLAGLRNEGNTAGLCRRYGISHSTFPTGSCKDNKWRRLFIQGGEDRLAKGPASWRERRLERENEES